VKQAKTGLLLLYCGLEVEFGHERKSATKVEALEKHNAKHRP
jgi:hypothetical protein